MTIRQRLFVKAIVGPALGNATKAAKLYTGKAATVRAIAYKTLNKTHVSMAIAHALSKRCQSPEWAVSALVHIASASMANILGDDGKGGLRVDWEKGVDHGGTGDDPEDRR